MTYYGSEEHEPVTYWRGHPVYAAHLAMVVLVGSLVICGMLRAFGYGGLLYWGIFESETVLKGQVWRLLSYGLVNVPSQVTVIWFALNMLMLVLFGREVEKTLGRKRFLTLFVSVYLVPVLLLTAIGIWMPTSLAGEHCTFAIFIAFATLFPGIPIFFALLANWVAIILLALNTLAIIADHDWAALISLWSTSAFAFAYIRHYQGRFSLPSFKFRRRPAAPKLRVLPDLPVKKPVTARPATASMAEVDALLDKIAQHGIGSLTAKERAKLDAARRDLKKRGGT